MTINTTSLENAIADLSDAMKETLADIKTQIQTIRVATKLTQRYFAKTGLDITRVRRPMLKELRNQAHHYRSLKGHLIDHKKRLNEIQSWYPG